MKRTRLQIIRRLAVNFFAAYLREQIRVVETLHMRSGTRHLNICGSLKKSRHRVNIMIYDSILVVRRLVALQTTDGGTYTCVAQNTAGTALSERVVDVFTAPNFGSELPEAKTVNVGEVRTGSRFVFRVN